MPLRAYFRSFSTAAWIALIPIVGTASCSSSDDGSTSAEALETGSGSWQLPSDVGAAGARVHLTYEDAPTWDGGRRCNGGLREGAQDLGHKLMSRFAAISSVVGYACRQNTADARRMSVHGSGRALDLMIPTTEGGADEEAGDPIANWLVVNATAIGVQLIIWNHSMWRANGTNIAPYDGPNPHVNHIHVEITEAAARRRTAFFTNGSTVDVRDSDAGSGSAVGDDEGDVYDVDAGYDDASVASNPNDPSTTGDTNPSVGDPNDPYGDFSNGDPYASGSDPYDPNDPYASDPYGSDPYANDPYGNGTGTTPTPSGPGSTTASGGARGDAGRTPTVVPRPYPSVADDSVGAPDSLGTGTRATPRSNAAPRKPPPQIETCAAVPGGHGVRGTASAWGALAIGIALARRRRQGARAR